MTEDLDIGRYRLGDLIHALHKSSLAEVSKGEKALLTVKGSQIAVYRNLEGKLEIVSATYSSIGTRLKHSWDCPCHGDRFTTAGKTICGPAVHDLGQNPR